MSRDIFDYVVVGGGSAGSVVAGRLGEAGRSVLVIEAGGTDRRIDIAVPAGIVSTYRTCNWKYIPEPDASRHGTRETWSAGRVLGGGGSINATVFVRGNRADFDDWSKGGCYGWDYDSVLPYFRRMESWAGERDEYRGTDGPIHVRYQTMEHPANEAFISAANQAGYPIIDDYNAKSQDGVARSQVNQRRGFRSQSSREYLRNGPGSERVEVRTKAIVDRILFENQKAIGVEYRHRGRTLTASARHEVVLSAGALASPKILMLSGVGPTQDLEALGIEVVHDSSRVGHNLQEHIGIMQRWHTSVPTINTMSPRDAISSIVEFARHGTGNLAATVFHAQAMHRTSPDTLAPDVQIAFASFATIRECDKNGVFHVKPAKENGFLVSTAFLHPRVRGQIRLRSSDPHDQLVIDHELIGNRDDLRDTLSGMSEARRIMEHSSMANLVAGQFDPESACRNDADWEDFVRANVTYGAHPVGTCRMGVDSDAVVDPELRVLGVSGFRVVDASVMPTSPSGNTNAPTMMIGEKAADLILGNQA